MANKSKNNVNTGKLLADYIEKNKINKAALGRSINRTGVSIVRYTYNNSIQTDILIDLCYALKHNFFQDIVNALPDDFTKNTIVDQQKIAFEESQKALLERIQEENKVLKIQNELLMKIKVP
jgi:hypothetical protein